MNRDQIKYIAIIAMTFNHAAYGLLATGTWMYEIFIDIGYVTAPVMAYFLTEGFYYTKSRKQYALRLAGFAVLSQVPYVRALGFAQLNMLFTILISFGILCVMHPEGKLSEVLCGTAKGAKPAPAASGLTGRQAFLIVVLTGCTIPCDWSVLFAVFVIVLELHRGDRERQCRDFMMMAVIFALLNVMGFTENYPLSGALLRGVSAGFGIAAAAVLIFGFYNGRQSTRFRKFNKWFFYIYYPLHLTVIWLMK